jgi:hypothetical protein
MKIPSSTVGWTRHYRRVCGFFLLEGFA